MEEEKKEFIEQTHNTKQKKSFTKKMRENPWMISSFVLAIFVLVILCNSFVGNITGDSISEEQVEELFLNYVGSMGANTDSIEITDIKSEKGLYKILFSYEGENYPFAYYISKDGSLIGLLDEIKSEEQIPSNSNTQTATEVPKLPKPLVETFVFAYCPYGLQFEKALASVYNLLKNKADINLVFIGAMHGEYEKQESIRQLCIQKEYGKDKLWGYLNKFMNSTEIGDCSSNMQCSKPLVETIMRNLSIDVNKISSCMNQEGQSLYGTDNAKASSLGISGSPTFVINGVQVSVARTSESIKQAVCNAFSDMPDECNQKLSADSVSPWFGNTASGGSSSASC